jgi:hypothetical protein
MESAGREVFSIAARLNLFPHALRLPTSKARLGITCGDT